MKRKKICIITIMVLTAFSLNGCLNLNPTETTIPTNETIFCPHYSFQLQVTGYYIQNDGSGYWMRDDRVVGGMDRIQVGADPRMDTNWLREDSHNFNTLISNTETAASEWRKLNNGLTAQSIDTVREGTQKMRHVFVTVTADTVFDFWFYQDAFSEADLTKFEQTFVLGGEKSYQPDSKRFITLYQPGGIRDETYQPNIGTSYCYLWEESESGVTLIETFGTGFGGLSAGTACDPIWSPDGQHLVITVETLDLTTFYFPLEQFQVEVPFPKNRKNLQIPFYMSHWEFDYELADAPRAAFFPIRWSEDSSQLLFHYSWTDSHGTRRSGNAWFVLYAKENKQILPD